MEWLSQLGSVHWKTSRKRIRCQQEWQSKDSENSLLHKTNKNTGKIVKMNRNVEIKQRLATIQEVFIQEKQLNLIKNSEFYLWHLSHPIPIAPPQLSSNLENKQPCNHSEKSSLADTGGSTMGLELPRSTIPRKLPLFDLSGPSLELSTHSTCLYLDRLGVF